MTRPWSASSRPASACFAPTSRRPRGPERVTTTGDRGAPGPLYVYGRAGRPCRRCRTPIERVRQGAELPRLDLLVPELPTDGLTAPRIIAPDV